MKHGAKTDAQRGKAFTKVVREIITAVRAGGADPDMNARLRLAVLKAKEVNMPNDNVKRAIQKAAGAGEGDQYEELLYEAYGPFGVALLIESLTDNRNRTITHLKMILNKVDGSLAAKGAVSYLFKKKGLILFPTGTSEEKVFEIGTECDVEDIQTLDDGAIEVTCPLEHYETACEKFKTAGLTWEAAEIQQIPSTTVALSEEQNQKIEDLVEKLEEDDDVQNIYTNAEQ